jgi:hypothetical protein
MTLAKPAGARRRLHAAPPARGTPAYWVRLTGAERAGSTRRACTPRTLPLPPGLWQRCPCRRGQGGGHAACVGPTYGLVRACGRWRPGPQANPAEAEGLIYGVPPMEQPSRVASGPGAQEAAQGSGRRLHADAKGYQASALARPRPHLTRPPAPLPAAPRPAPSQQLPRARRCRECPCHGESTRGRLHTAQALDTTESGPDYHIGGRVYNISDIAPGRRIFQSKQHLPNCTLCRGCDHTLVRDAGCRLQPGRSQSAIAPLPQPRVRAPQPQPPLATRRPLPLPRFAGERCGPCMQRRPAHPAPGSTRILRRASLPSPALVPLLDGPSNPLLRSSWPAAPSC